MLRTLAISAFMLLISLNIYSQDPFSKLDKIQIDSIHILNSNNKLYSLGTRNDLKATWGKPRIKKQEDEVLGGYAYFCYYNGAEFYFNEQSFEAVTITTSQNKVLLNGKSYTVGDNINKLRSHFPNSFKKREAKPEGGGILHLLMCKDSVIFDASIAFSFDSNNKIREITLANDNS